MNNFAIRFEYPWLLLLLVAALIVTFIPYFRIKKRYRNTRNRIISMILHLLVSVLAVSVLAGVQFTYEVPNQQNQIILLVDVSDTQEGSATERDQFVSDVLSDCAYDDFNVGVVTFGFDQVYAVPMSNKTQGMYQQYLTAAQPDKSATNVAAAIRYATTLFTHPETGKILLVSDGKETDEKAVDAIYDATAKGITVDTAFVASELSGSDVQVTALTMPDYYVQRGIECEILATVYSSGPSIATAQLLDNGQASGSPVQIDLIEGYQNVAFKHVFDGDGLHEIRVSVAVNDSVDANNEYCSYHYLEVFDRILVIERDDQSQPFTQMLNSGNSYKIDVVNVSSEQMPKNINQLREYHQVVLNNIANSELPEGFDLILEEFVSVHGGGLLTLGGNNEQGKANAYDRKDLYGTVYQEMLPVEASTYTPPIGVMLVIDSSGSMASENDYGTSFFESAKAGALACLDVLYDRDYVGIMTLASDHAMILDMTERTKETVIREAIAGIDADFGNTVFGSAIENAGLALRALKNVAKRHIIVISDGMTEEPETYLPKIQEFYRVDGITFSVIGLNMNDQSRAAMQIAVNEGHGRLHEASNTKDLVDSVKQDLLVPKIEDVNTKEFKPIVNNLTSQLVQGLGRGEGVDRNRLDVTLGGFYGSKIKDGADLVLIGEYDVPVYAQWKYGSGMVGSFLCDLQQSDWSKDFMASQTGQTFIKNVVNNLMPVANLQPSDISVKLKQDNYTNQLSVLADLEDRESIRGKIVYTKDGEQVTVDLNSASGVGDAPIYVTSALSEQNGYSRCSFVAKRSGVYQIILSHHDANGNQIGNSLTVNHAVSYSEEYDNVNVMTSDQLKKSMDELATVGGGMSVIDLSDTATVFNGFVTTLEKKFDPRWLFMILAIILFLLDVAVCKFKFKWIHEIIRDRKRRKEM